MKEKSVITNCPNCDEKITMQLISNHNSKDKKIIDECKKIISCYLQYLFENKPEYRKEQYYYDGYYKKMEYISFGRSKGFLLFTIQTVDSPDGDVWLHVLVPMQAGIIKWQYKKELYSSYGFPNAEEFEIAKNEIVKEVF